MNIPKLLLLFLQFATEMREDRRRGVRRGVQAEEAVAQLGLENHPDRRRPDCERRTTKEIRRNPVRVGDICVSLSGGYL